MKRICLPATILAVALFALPAWAQRVSSPSSGGGGISRGGGSGGTSISPGTQPANSAGFPSTLDSPFSDPDRQYPFPKAPLMVEDESCLPWDLPDIRGATVSVTRLEVPSKARDEFNKGCNSYHNKKFTDAEQRMRSAIEKYSSYAAAWVMLGESLKSQEKIPQANDACNHALGVDPSYLPPYLCLSDIAARGNQWGDLLDISKRALELGSTGNRYVYYFQAVGYFGVYKLQEAEKSALRAIDLDREHHDPALYFLTAQIYEEEGNVAEAINRIKQFMKFNADRKEGDKAKEILAKLQSEQGQ